MEIVQPAGPPLGWNSYDSYDIHLDEGAALANLKRFVSQLKPAGYEYFVIDGGWYCEYELVPGTELPKKEKPIDFHIDEYGRYLPSRTYFRQGLARIADRCHAYGLKFGIHIMRGIPRRAVELNLPILGTNYSARDIADTTDTCRWCDWNYGIDVTRPGGQEYYDSWIGLLASWDVDFIKADDITAFPKEITAVAEAVERSGRPITLSLSPGKDADMAYVAEYRQASMVRTTPDIWDERDDLDRCFAAWRAWQGEDRGPLWLDLDMLALGSLRVKHGRDPYQERDGMHASLGAHRRSRLTEAQQRTFVATRALAASPLFMGGDLLSSDEAAFEMITNTEMLDCNQNGVGGSLRYDKDGIEAWVTPRRDAAGRGWMGVFNRNQRATAVAVPISVLSPPVEGPARLRDVWSGGALDDMVRDNILVAQLNADDVLFLAYDASSQSSKETPSA